MKIKILSFARDDLIDGYHFYEWRQPGLGDYFLESLYSDIESLERIAGIHRMPFGKFYRLLSERFPYAVYYSMEDDLVKIQAVVDCRKNPKWILDHLGEAEQDH